MLIKEIDKLHNKKASQNPNIPINIIKESKDLILYFLHHNFNNSLSFSTFPIVMKYADVKPIPRKTIKLIQKITSR